MDAFSSWIADLARRIRDTLGEMNYASARATAMMMSDGLEAGDRAPAPGQVRPGPAGRAEQRGPAQCPALTVGADGRC
jgi:hypothetical protein